MAPWYIVEPKWVQFMKVIVVLLLTAALLTDVRRIHALVWAIVISLGYYGVKGGAFAILTAGEYRVFGPAASMIEDNNHLAAALLVTLPLMNYLRLHSEHRLVRVGLLGAMGLTLLVGGVELLAGSPAGPRRGLPRPLVEWSAQAAVRRLPRARSNRRRHDDAAGLARADEHDPDL